MNAVACNFVLEIEEDGRRIRVAASAKLTTLLEAIAEAKRHVDDALPRNYVRVYMEVGTAYLAGDGSVEYRGLGS